MSNTETTSARVASIAAKYIHHEDPNVRALAASCLTQHAIEEATPTPSEKYLREMNEANLPRPTDPKR